MTIPFGLVYSIQIPPASSDEGKKSRELLSADELREEKAVDENAGSGGEAPKKRKNSGKRKREERERDQDSTVSDCQTALMP